MVDGNPLTVSASFLDDNSVNWAIAGGSATNVLPDSLAGSQFELLLRLGDLQPLFTDGHRR